MRKSQIVTVFFLQTRIPTEVQVVKGLWYFIRKNNKPKTVFEFYPEGSFCQLISLAGNAVMYPIIRYCIDLPLYSDPHQNLKQQQQHPYKIAHIFSYTWAFRLYKRYYEGWLCIYMSNYIYKYVRSMGVFSTGMHIDIIHYTSSAIEHICMPYIAIPAIASRCSKDKEQR